MKKIVLLTLSLFSISLLAHEIQSSGEVYVNDQKVTSQTVIKLGDFIKTGKNSKVKFNIGNDAFMAKENTKFSITQNSGLKSLKVVAGGVLAVFEKGGKHEVKTENMTAGIRGTAVYLEQLEGKSYFCTCYGETDLKSHEEEQHFKAIHHNMVWVKANGTIKPELKMLGHNDNELRELEAMVGRVPDFDKQ